MLKCVFFCIPFFNILPLQPVSTSFKHFNNFNIFQHLSLGFLSGCQLGLEPTWSQRSAPVSAQRPPAWQLFDKTHRPGCLSASPALCQKCSTRTSKFHKTKISNAVGHVTWQVDLMMSTYTPLLKIGLTSSLNPSYFRLIIPTQEPMTQQYSVFWCRTRGFETEKHTNTKQEKRLVHASSLAFQSTTEQSKMWWSRLLQFGENDQEIRWDSHFALWRKQSKLGKLSKLSKQSERSKVLRSGCADNPWLYDVLWSQSHSFFYYSELHSESCSQNGGIHSNSRNSKNMILYVPSAGKFMMAHRMIGHHKPKALHGLLDRSCSSCIVRSDTFFLRKHGR